MNGNIYRLGLLALLLVCSSSLAHGQAEETGSERKAKPASVDTQALQLAADWNGPLWFSVGTSFFAYRYPKRGTSWEVSALISSERSLYGGRFGRHYVFGKALLGAELDYLFFNFPVGGSQVSLRPVVGVALGQPYTAPKFRLVYGYNLRLSNDIEERLERHQLSLRFCFLLTAPPREATRR